MTKFEATYNGRKVTVSAVSPAKAIFTAAKIFQVKPQKVSVKVLR